VLEHKSGNISETRRLNIEEKLLWRAYMKSQKLFRTVPSPTPHGLPFPKIRGLQPHPQSAIAIISGTAKATDCKFARYIHRVHPNKSPLKIWEKRERAGVSRDRPNFWSTPYYLRTRKATNFKFGRYIHRVHANKSPTKIWEKRDCPIFLSTPYYLRNR